MLFFPESILRQQVTISLFILPRDPDLNAEYVYKNVYESKIEIPVNSVPSRII